MYLMRRSHVSALVDFGESTGGFVPLLRTKPRRLEASVGGGFESDVASSSKTRAELDGEAQVFAADLIRTWVADPSNIRLLRIAFDLWPSAEALQEVLDLLMPRGTADDDDNANRIAQYCLAEIFRAGATETGFSKTKRPLGWKPMSTEKLLKGPLLRFWITPPP